MRPACIMVLMLAFTLFIPPSGEWTRTAARQTAVTLWTGEAVWTHKYEGAERYLTAKWSRSAKLNFTVDSHRNLGRTTLKMFHALDAEWKAPDPTHTLQTVLTGRDERSPGADMREVLQERINSADVQMSVKTCAPELSATAGGLSDNTLILNAVATPIIVFRSPYHPEMRRALGLVMKIEFAYKYDQVENQSPEKDVPQGVELGYLPVPTARGGPSSEPARMKVILKRKPLELRYEPLASDVSSQLSGFKDYSRVTPYYATGEGNRFVHANNSIRVVVDGQDVTTNFVLSRFANEWSQPLDLNGFRSGRLRQVSQSWFDDSGGSKHWVDAPGLIWTNQPPNKWPRERFMQEFLAGVEGFPEFGALYFIVVIDTKPNGYRVRMYSAKKITIDEWCAIKTRKAPYQTEASSGTAVVDSDWQPAR